MVQSTPKARLKERKKQWAQQVVSDFNVLQCTTIRQPTFRLFKGYLSVFTKEHLEEALKAQNLFHVAAYKVWGPLLLIYEKPQSDLATGRAFKRYIAGYAIILFIYVLTARLWLMGVLDLLALAKGLQLWLHLPAIGLLFLVFYKGANTFTSFIQALCFSNAYQAQKAMPETLLACEDYTVLDTYLSRAFAFMQSQASTPLIFFTRENIQLLMQGFYWEEGLFRHLKSQNVYYYVIGSKEEAAFFEQPLGTLILSPLAADGEAFLVLKESFTRGVKRVPLTLLVWMYDVKRYGWIMLVGTGLVMSRVLPIFVMCYALFFAWILYVLCAFFIKDMLKAVLCKAYPVFW